ncbi:MAG TPA: outer membrane beta-barrel protein [Pyrinomonadaceae bacterium]|nr:outer membrane beta-barrel protein [Pyrinomonadaceae bacterium]
MRKLFMAAVLIACTAPFTFAQTTGDDYNKVDVFLGYSHNRVDTGVGDSDPDFDDIVDEREGFHGVNASITGNVSRYVGLKGDYAFHRKSFDVSDGVDTFTINANLHTFVGGVQLKDNAKETKVKPFAHLMAGVAHAKFSVEDLGGFDESETGLTGVIGGGIDVKVNDRVDFRVVQFDYNPTRFGGSTQHNFRVGIGVVFR